MDPDVPPSTTLRQAGMTLHLLTYTVVRTDGHTIQLTPREFRVLYILMQHTNSLVTMRRLGFVFKAQEAFR
jgi:DNA-binding response OmpR family regulator